MTSGNSRTDHESGAYTAQRPRFHYHAQATSFAARSEASLADAPVNQGQKPHTEMPFVTKPRGQPKSAAVTLGTRNQIRRQRGQLLAGLFEFAFGFRRFDDAGAGTQPGLPIAFVGRSQRQRGIQPTI
jgi:hypothetical protein